MGTKIRGKQIFDRTIKRSNLSDELAGNGLVFTESGFDINVDDSTINIINDAIQVKDSGISVTQLADNIDAEPKGFNAYSVGGKTLQEIESGFEFSLTEEINNRINADQNLQNQINEFESGFDSRLNQEIQDRTLAGQLLQNNIDILESGFDARLNQEIIDRSSADSILQNEIDILESGLDSVLYSPEWSALNNANVDSSQSKLWACMESVFVSGGRTSFDDDTSYTGKSNSAKYVYDTTNLLLQAKETNVAGTAWMQFGLKARAIKSSGGLIDSSFMFITAGNIRNPTCTMRMVDFTPTSDGGSGGHGFSVSFKVGTSNNVFFNRITSFVTTAVQTYSATINLDTKYNAWFSRIGDTFSFYLADGNGNNRSRIFEYTFDNSSYKYYFVNGVDIGFDWTGESSNNLAIGNCYGIAFYIPLMYNATGL